MDGYNRGYSKDYPKVLLRAVLIGFGRIATEFPF